jgi:hypothetical protein
MKKRLRKKISKRELCVVVYGISIDGFWRKRLFDSQVYKKYFINLENSSILPKEIFHLLRRFQRRRRSACDCRKVTERGLA